MLRTATPLFTRGETNIVNTHVFVMIVKLILQYLLRSCDPIYLSAHMMHLLSSCNAVEFDMLVRNIYLVLLILCAWLYLKGLATCYKACHISMGTC